jgi:hypothetical protein
MFGFVEVRAVRSRPAPFTSGISGPHATSVRLASKHHPTEQVRLKREAKNNRPLGLSENLIVPFRRTEFPVGKFKFQKGFSIPLQASAQPAKPLQERIRWPLQAKKH